MSVISYKISVIGTNVTAIDSGALVDQIIVWGRSSESRYVVFANAHVVVTARSESNFRESLVDADLALPDGASVVWLMRKLGFVSQKRISGPDTMLYLLERCALEGLPVYFYGSTDETLNLLLSNLTTKYPNLVVAGCFSPPFRAISEDEDAEFVGRINSSGAKLVFVGLGCPKQELWMSNHRGQVNAVMLGVGAAFDFHAGTVSRAPVWMRESGFEWLHRLMSEPKRLWKRYLVTNTLFIWLAVKQLILGS